MDTRFHNFTQTIRDVERAEHTQQRFSKEVTGRGNTQNLVSVAGSKPEGIKQIKQTYAKPVSFSGETPLGAERGRHIAASADAPKSKKNDGLKKTFPKVFTDRIERPPDNLFSTKAAQSLGPWQNKDQTPVSMSVPPIRLPGQKLFPMNKQETVASWRKLMSQHGAQTMGIGSVPSAEKSGLAPAPPLAPPPPAPPLPPVAAPAPRAPTPPPKTKVHVSKKPSPVPAPPLPPVPPGDVRTFRKASDDELNDHLKRLDPLGTTPMDDAVRMFIEDELKTRAGFPALSSPVKRKSGRKTKK